MAFPYIPPGILPTYPYTPTRPAPPQFPPPNHFHHRRTSDPRMPRSQVDKPTHPPRGQSISTELRVGKSSEDLERAIASLTEHVKTQESRIRDLENELKNHQLACHPASPSVSLSANLSAQNVVSVTDLLSLDAVDGEAQDKESNLQLLLEQIEPTPVTPGASAISLTENKNLVNLLDDSMPEEYTGVLAESWTAFEQHLAKRGEPPKYGTPPAKKEAGGLQTLIEGVGSIEELTIHEKGTEKDPAINEGALTCTSVPWDRKIAWADGAEELFTNDPYKFPCGVVYDPDEGEDNVYRTVTVSNISPKVYVRFFMKGIRGGEVYSAFMFAHEGLPYNMAKITFVREESAQRYVHFVKNNGISYLGQRITAELDKTPTYPLSKEMEDKIFKDGHTRCVSIRGPADEERAFDIVDHLCDRHPHLAYLAERVLRKTCHTEVILCMHSIPAAQSLIATLKANPEFAGCEFDFAADPAARPFPDGSEENPRVVFSGAPPGYK